MKESIEESLGRLLFLGVGAIFLGATSGLRAGTGSFFADAVVGVWGRGRVSFWIPVIEG